MVTRMRAIMASLKEIANDNSSDQSDLAAEVYHKIHDFPGISPQSSGHFGWLE